MTRYSEYYGCLSVRQYKGLSFVAKRHTRANIETLCNIRGFSVSYHAFVILPFLIVPTCLKH